MRDQELIGLYEAYQQVHGLNESTEELEYDTQYSYEDWVNQLVEEGYDLSNWTDEGLFEYYEQLCEESLEKGQSPTPGGVIKPKITPAIPPKPPKGTKVNTGYKESYDIVFEYLITEGYADTNENALVIMANMSEEWRNSIVEEKIVKSGVSVNAAGQKIPWTHSHNTATGKSTVKDKFGKRDASVSAKIKPKMD